MRPLGSRLAVVALSATSVASVAATTEHDPRLGTGSQDDVAQRSALLRVFKSTDGSHWTNNSGWTTDTSYCTWYGVGCDPNGNVRNLGLARNNLAGVWPDVCVHLSARDHPFSCS